MSKPLHQECIDFLWCSSTDSAAHQHSYHALTIDNMLKFVGPSKLPQLGKELGKTVKSFQTAAKVRLSKHFQITLNG